MTRPQLQELVLAEDPAAWEALGFVVDAGACRIGPATLRLTGGEGGIASMAIEGVRPGEIDGLAVHAAGPPAAVAAHPLGVRAIDHVVIATPDADRTSQALAAAGLDLRRMQDVPGERPLRRGFLLARDALLEVVGPARPGAELDGPRPGEEEGHARPAGFWGLTLVVDDLDRAAARLGEHCGSPRDAVQPGRRIATVRPSTGVRLPLALITPRA